MLHLLITNTGQVLTTDMIIERVWGYDEAGDSGLVKTHIRHLRQKVEPDPNTPQYIMTVPGVGYTFTAPISIESKIPGRPPDIVHSIGECRDLNPPHSPILQTPLYHLNQHYLFLTIT